MGERRSAGDLPVCGVSMKRTIGEGTEERLVQVSIERITLEGNLTLPEGAAGLVLFCHRTGSSRASPPKRPPAENLDQTKPTTPPVDLFTPQEEAICMPTDPLRFDN